MKICGIWYPAGSSERHNATLFLNQEQYRLQMDEVDQPAQPINAQLINVQPINAQPIMGFVSELETSQRVGNIPRKITFNNPSINQSIFETQDNDKIDQWIELGIAGVGSGALRHKIESKWRWIVSALVIVILISFAGFNWGLPWSSQVLARTMPNSVVKKVSVHTMAVLDKLFFEPSKISATRQEELQTHFGALIQIQNLKKNQATEFKLHFRKLGVANVFALPSGDIIISDEFLAAIKKQHQEQKNQEQKNQNQQHQIDAVLLHEIGHVVNSHGLQQMIRASIVSFAAAMIAGDPSGLEEVFVALPTFMLHSHYSRKYEVEADLFALEMMIEKGIDPIHFVEALEALEKLTPNLPKAKQESSAQEEELKQANSAEHSVADYFSSHPTTSERIATALEYSKRFRQKRN